MRFNENQLRAVSHKEGPMLVLAGPGSGKTTVITGRIQTLIDEYNVPPGNILAVTFSRAAASEMSARFESLFAGHKSSMVHFATIHSIFLRILKDSGRCGKLKLISEREKQIFIRTELEKLNIHTEDTAGSVREILLALSRSKSGSPASASSVPAELLLKITNDYTDHMKQEGLIDFDDILIMCRNLLYEDSALLKRCRDQYRYILVDEFQDVSPVQYETLQMLEGLNRNIFVVGDDDQSIYGFRGAAPSVIRRFLYDHPDADTVSLNINYRSVPEIVAAASAVIASDSERMEKEIHSVKAPEGAGALIMRAFENRRDEYLFIISRLKDPGMQSDKRTAILFRNNDDASLLLHMLEDHGIGYNYSGAAGKLTDHFTVKDILAYIETACCMAKGNTIQTKQLIRIINRPVRFISRESIESGSTCVSEVCDPFREMLSFYMENHRMTARINLLQSQLKLLAALSPFAQIKYIRGVIGYDRWLEDFASENGTDPEQFSDKLDAFEEYAADYSSADELISALSKDRSVPPIFRNKKEEKISIMTIHASKGLEFENVFIPDANDSIIPGKHSLKEGNIAEERRLLYVAMTRAADRLFITWSRSLHNKKAFRSRFLDCLDDHTS